MLIIFLFTLELVLGGVREYTFILKRMRRCLTSMRQQQVTVRLTDKDLKQLEFCSRRISIFLPRINKTKNNSDH